jgi:hypothetical protein
MKTILHRLKQPSTLAGLGTLGALFGLPAGLFETIGTIIVSGIAIFEIIRNER